MAAIGQERDKDVITYAGFTGLRDDVTADRFEISDLVVANNVDLDKSGKISRRAGYTRVATSSGTHSIWANPAATACLCVAGQQLCRVNTDYTLQVLTTLDSNGHMAYESIDDKVYYSNGVDTGVYDVVAGRVRNWGVQRPTALGVTTSVGILSAGRYQFVMTYVRDDGYESGATAAQFIDVEDGESLQFVLPLSSDPDVVAKIIYVSPADGDMLFQAQVLPNSAVSATYNGGDLSRPLDTQFMQPAPAGTKIAYYRGRVFVAQGSTLYCSSDFGYELFDIRRYVELDGAITLLAAIADKEQSGSATNSGLFVGTDKTCGVLVGSGPEDFQYVPKTNYGAIDGAVAFVDGALYGDGSVTARSLPMWLTSQGICVGMPGMQIQNITTSKYGIAASGQGAALFMPGLSRIILTYNL